MQKLNISQAIVAQRHISRHKWLNHIGVVGPALEDFFNKYGPFMREVYCEACDFSKVCDEYKIYLKRQEERYKKEADNPLPKK